MRYPASFRSRWLTLLLVLFIAACGSAQPNILGKWGEKADSPDAIEFFKDGTFTMSEGPAKGPFSGKWIALDDGRIKADLEMLGTTTTFLFVRVGEELEINMGGKKSRLVRKK